MTAKVHDPPMPGRALFLTHEPPLPAVTGSRVRSHALMRELCDRGWEIDLFAVAAEGEAVDEAALGELCGAHRVARTRRRGARGRLQAAAAIAAMQPLPRWFFHSRELAREFAAAFDPAAYDLVMVEGLYMYPYVPAKHARKALLDCHNAEAPRLQSMARALGIRPRGIAARLQHGPLRAYEERAAKTVAGCLAVSGDEAALLEPMAPGRVRVVPNGVDVAGIVPRTGVPEGAEILFVGALDYSANRDAVEFLLHSVLPELKVRSASLTLVGRGQESLAEDVGRAETPVRLTGRVADTAPWFERARVFAAPLRFGGGTRLKILEAMARGVPVVTTTVGCEGLGLRHGHDALIADDPAGFAAELDRALTDDALCRSLAAAARATAEQRFDWHASGAALEAAIAGLVPA